MYDLLIKIILLMIINGYKKILRKLRVKILYPKPQNNNYSIICNNCVGAMLSHDYGEQFLSPTVNLFITPKDYITFLRKLDGFQDCPIVDITGSNNYPIGLLDKTIQIHFMHYSSFEEAKEKWTERYKRINFSNLYIILIEKDGCTINDLIEFDNLPYKNKIAITHKDYPHIKCAKKISGYENCHEVGLITDFNGFFGKRHYDRIDWASFLSK